MTFLRQRKGGRELSFGGWVGPSLTERIWVSHCFELPLLLWKMRVRAVPSAGGGGNESIQKDSGEATIHVTAWSTEPVRFQ